MNEKPKSLSREFVIRSILHIFDAVESERRWGSVTISFQAGAYRCIEEKKTTTTEGADEG